MNVQSFYADRNLLDLCEKTQRRLGARSFSELARASLVAIGEFNFLRQFDLNEQDIFILTGRKLAGFQTIKNLFDNGTIDKQAAEKALRALLRNRAEWQAPETEPGDLTKAENEKSQNNR